MELIDREALMNLLNFYTDETVSAIIADVEAIQVIEAGAVVRCKDCRRSRTSIHRNSVICIEHGKRMLESDFCSYGERKAALNAEKGNEV